MRITMFLDDPNCEVKSDSAASNLSTQDFPLHSPSHLPGNVTLTLFEFQDARNEND